MFKKIKEKIIEYKFLILFGIVISIIAHGMILNNFLINEDSLDRLSNGSTFRMIRSGRWASFIITDYILRGNYIPFFNNSFSIAFLVASGVIITDVFELKHKMARIFTVSAYSLLPLISIMFGYAYDILNYSFALLLIVVGVTIIIKFKKVVSKLFACVLIAFSIGIYQSFISIASAFLLSYYLLQIIKGKKINAKEVIINIIYLILSLVLYYIILKVLLTITGLSLTGYKNANNFNIKDVILNLPQNVLNTIKYYRDYLFGRTTVLKTHYSTHLIILLFFMIFIIYFIKNILNKKINIKENIIIILLVILYIPALYSITLITQTYDYSSEYGITFFTILIISCCFEMVANKYIKTFLSILTTALIVLGLLSTNYIHTQQKLLSKMTYNYYLLIYNDVLKNEDYDKDTKVFFYGKVTKNNNYLKSKAKIYKYMKEGYKNGPAGLGNMTSKKYMFYRDRKAHYLLDYYYFSLNGYDEIEVKGNKKLKERLFNCGNSMPNYPKEGSIKKCPIEDVIIVKLGDY
ncbi:hypothetical protein OKW22_000233 [Bacilli bacterium PM5-3]|nr:hypothetical protein [Bacilli bacterium PM5-3]MDH6603944.1 hypothetical protein [Bacilli bacterium PM5-9]